MADAYGASSPSSSTCSESSSYSQYYDLFISHRGPDVKTTFAMALYRSLKSCRIRAFLDESEMEEGRDITSQLENAIRVASVHVAIFSPNYAGSKWCLDELLLIVESVKSGRATLLPVFYNVNPAELRRTGKDKTGVYAVDLLKQEQERHHDSQTVQNWREALAYAADISGLELEESNGGVLGLLDRVVQRVVKAVPKPVPKPPLPVATYPTGLQQKVEEFEKRVLSVRQNGKAKVVGIVGCGGVGKSTVAKQFFNNKRSLYRRASFLFDVAKKPLFSSQSQLIKDLKGLDIKIESSHEGLREFDRHLSNCQALIVLDDIDHGDQLDAFLPIKKVLHRDSLLLVTSRDKQVLRSAKIENPFIYHLKGLNPEHSRELFCSYAFPESHPPLEFNDVVDGFLKTCDGLPLSLKVLGALLFGENNKSHWQEVLSTVHDILPQGIQNSLRVSYDSLNDKDKEIFLDISCFCIGEQPDKWIKIWDGSGWHGSVGFKTLQDKCLVEVDTENIIRMNDHLRTMGRNIAQEGSLPKRIWRGTSRKVFELLQQSFDVTTEVRGIKMDPPAILRHTYAEEPFRSTLEELLNQASQPKINKLQLLEGHGNFVESMLKVNVRLPNLISLRWNDCPCTCLPSFPMHDLTVLEVDGRKLERLWEFDSQAPQQLRQLNIDAPLIEFPKSLGKLQHLEKMVVKSARLATLPDSLGDLRNLQHIALVGCENLEMLPASLGNLTTLQHMNLSMCKSLRVFPDSMEKLTNLQFINLDSCKSLEKLPHSLLNFKNLKCIPCIKYAYHEGLHIDFSGFQSLKMLPDSLRDMGHLVSIDLTGCESLKMLPDFWGQFRNLGRINLEM